MVAPKVTHKTVLQGVSLDCDIDFKYFGLLAVGAAWYTGGTWQYTLEHGMEPFGYGKPMLVVLRGLQPHARIAFWHFVFSAQVGFEGHALIIQPVSSLTQADYDNKTIWFLDAQLDAQIGLRAYIIEGLYVEGIYRLGWTFQNHAADRGFHAGVGYAF